MINKAFQCYYQNNNCDGKVVLAENPDDFSQYALDIYVKYRKEGHLRKLEGHFQSGGEKSVATMLFLLCLQNVTDTPFRVVDEINQAWTRPTNA